MWSSFGEECIVMKHVWWLKYIFLWKANGGWERRQKATGSITWWGKEETRSKKEKRRRTTGSYFLYSWHINVSIWATACLLLPQPNINLLLVDCSCVRGRYIVAQSLTLIQVESDEQGIGSSWGILIDHFYFLWKCFWQNTLGVFRLININFSLCLLLPLVKNVSV